MFANKAVFQLMPRNSILFSQKQGKNMASVLSLPIRYQCKEFDIFEFYTNCYDLSSFFSFSFDNKGIFATIDIVSDQIPKALEPQRS